MQKALITGSSGLLGAHLMAAFSKRAEVHGVDRHPWWGDRPLPVRLGDLADGAFLGEVLIAARPDILIHCAAITDVDRCEQDPSAAAACHEKLTKELASRIPRHCLFVYVSTDGLFKGDRPFAAEEDSPAPLTVYARSKLLGERQAAQAANHLIVRTNFYGWGSGRKRTAAEWLYQALAAGQEITLFRDFYFTPIYVVDFVERLIRLVEGGHRGLFHLAGKERVSKHQFGALMAEEAEFSFSSVREGSLDDSPLKALRPKDISLRCDRFRTATGMDLPDCRTGLLRFLADRDRPLSMRFSAEPSSVERTGHVSCRGATRPPAVDLRSVGDSVRMYGRAPRGLP